MDAPYVCVATRLHARGVRVLPAFLRSSFTVARTARSTPGNVRTRLLGMPPFLTFFTLSVWESEEAMRSFVRTAEHRDAMTHMDEWASDGRFAEFRTPAARVGWRAAWRQLRADTAVRHQPLAK